jgi:putative transposase
VIIDQHSRHVVGVEVLRRAPRGEDALRALEQATEKFEPPKYLIVDLGSHFQNATFLEGCAAKGITVRKASAGSLRATAHVERFIRTLKAELPWAPGDLVTSRLAARIEQYLAWYHNHRPHQGLGGRTPNEVLLARRPANKRPRFEPRSRWPRGARCANPQAPPRRGSPGRLALVVDRGELGLPIVRLERAA